MIRNCSGKSLMVEKDATGSARPAKCISSKTPYTLPTDAQLLAYWHYQSGNVQQQDLSAADGGIFPRPVKKFERDNEEAWVQKRRRDANDDLIKELRGGNKTDGRSAFSASRYVQDIRLLSKWRLIAGQKRDGCIQLDQQHDIEQQKYLEVKREYRECVTALESFLAQDHEESMRALSAAEAELKLTTELSERRDELSRRYGQTRLQVYHWEEAWRTVKACQRFLQRVSPLGNEDEDADADDQLEYRSAAEDIRRETVRSSSTCGASGDNSITTATPRPPNTITGSEIGHADSLESLIAAFEREAIGISKSLARSPAHLGLLEPADLLRLFRDIELQNLNALIHLESLGGPMADMIARIDVAEIRVRREIEDVFEGIKQLERAIEREERRAQRLERQSGQLVQRRFRALVCSAEALQARILVEEAYESCVAPNEAGLDGLAMARGLEAAYEKLSAELDALPRHLVHTCERDGFQQEMKESREAEEAARKFELMQRLLAALRRIMEPTESRRRMLVRRSMPKIRRKRRCKAKKEHNHDSKPAAARDDEALHLDFFGKLCSKPKKTDDDSDMYNSDDDVD